MMVAVGRFDELKKQLIAELRSERDFRFINTRLILKTGVDLDAADSGDAADSAELYEQVCAALQEMGFLQSRTGT